MALDYRTYKDRQETYNEKKGDEWGINYENAPMPTQLGGLFAKWLNKKEAGWKQKRQGKMLKDAFGNLFKSGAEDDPVMGKDSDGHKQETKQTSDGEDNSGDAGPYKRSLQEEFDIMKSEAEADNTKGPLDYPKFNPEGGILENDYFDLTEDISQSEIDGMQFQGGILENDYGDNPFSNFDLKAHFDLTEDISKSEANADLYYNNPENFVDTMTYEGDNDGRNSQLADTPLQDNTGGDFDEWLQRQPQSVYDEYYNLQDPIDEKPPTYPKYNPGDTPPPITIPSGLSNVDIQQEIGLMTGDQLNTRAGKEYMHLAGMDEDAQKQLIRERLSEASTGQMERELQESGYYDDDDYDMGPVQVDKAPGFQEFGDWLDVDSAMNTYDQLTNPTTQALQGNNNPMLQAWKRQIGGR